MAHASTAPGLSTAPPLDPGVRIRLSIMMLLQFAIWGAWFVVLGTYLEKGRGFSGTEIGSIYGTMALGAIISMMVAGQLADRLLASEYLMAIFHLAGAGLLYWMSQVTTFEQFWLAAFIYALVYNPTLAISNSLAFANIPDATRDFPTLRVLGTIGWIAAGLAVDFVLPKGAAETNRPLLMAAVLSAALGLFSLVLPHTPPSGKKGDALPFLKAFGLLKDPSFAIFFGLSFAITIALAFYYGFTNVFLGDIGVTNIATTMSFGQMSEIGFMLLLPFALKHFGMKWVLAIGMSAWALRYAFFSIAADGHLFVLILFGVILHGVCFDFFLAAGFIHTDNKAPASIRGSAQALFSFLTYGVGMWIGNEISGRIVDAYTTYFDPETLYQVNPKTGLVIDPEIVAQFPDPTSLERISFWATTWPESVIVVRDWASIWIIPAIGAAVCLALFIVLWRDTAGKLEEEVEEARHLGIDPMPTGGNPADR